MPSLLLPCCILSMLPRQRDHNLSVGHIEDKLCLVTIDTGTSVMIANPDITTKLLNRGLTKLYIIQMVSG